ncbi:MAG: twin-arginine translocase subunit TatB [Jatrophihabitans sp.]|nr:MAG: twin-arginine translocase subunit TatB [Jatrophihabitans sp.]
MFNIGPMELIVLAIVGIVVLGPERLPGLARDAARLLRALREVAQGARTQLRDELGPELADLDLRNLNPKTAIRRAVLGDDFDAGISAGDLRFDPKKFFQDALDDEPAAPVTLTKADANGSAAAPAVDQNPVADPAAGPATGPAAGSAPQRPRPRPRPYPAAQPPTPYDPDTT